MHSEYDAIPRMMFQTAWLTEHKMMVCFIWHSLTIFKNNGLLLLLSTLCINIRQQFNEYEPEFDNDTENYFEARS